MIPDRIEAGTLAVCAAVCGGDVTLSPVIIEHMEIVAAKLVEAGAGVEVNGETLRVFGDGVLRAAPHPLPALSRLSY